MVEGRVAQDDGGFLREMHDQERAAAARYAPDYDAVYESPYWVSERRALAITAWLTAARRGIYPPRARVLDVGCGTGSLLREVRRLGARRLSAVDISEDMVGIARSRVPGVDFRVGPVEDQDYAPGSFDIVIGFSVLHHLPDLELFFRWLTRVLRPGGVFAFSDGNALASVQRQRRARRLTFALHRYFARRNRAVCAHRPDMSDDSYYSDCHRALTADEVARAVGPDLWVRSKVHGVFAPPYDPVLVGGAADRAALVVLRSLDRLYRPADAACLVTLGGRRPQGQLVG